MQLTGQALSAATQGIWHHGVPESVTHIQTDSRAFEEGDVFLALRGEHFDGHRFGVVVAERACALIGDKEGLAAWKALDVPQLEVDDTLQAYASIAHAWREKLVDTTVVGITGSYGKTTVRSMLSHLLTGLGLKVHATQANLNNLIGVPQTLLACPSSVDVALIECGISEQGEMQCLADILSPDAVMMTGMTSAHAEGLGGLKGVVQEKSKLLYVVKKNGWCALAKGVKACLQSEHIQVPCRQFALDVTWELQGQSVCFSYQGETARLELSLPAKHWCENMAWVLSIALQMMADKARKPHAVPSFQDMVHIMDSWQAVDGRLASYAGVHGSRILDDSYNANPVSMQAALHTLQAMPDRRIAILGDMKELGATSMQAHQALDIQGIECVYLVGEQMRYLHEIHADTLWFLDVNALLIWLQDGQDNIQQGDTILVKGSHSMQLEKVVQMLRIKE